MTQAIKNKIAHAITYRERIFYVLVSVIIGLGVAYAGLVHSTVQNIITREAVLKQNRYQSGLIGELEAKYFALKDSVTLAVAHDMGFSEPISPLFLSKNANKVARSSNEI